ncbi:MAG: Vms1/Ankzf1 family peptidyl-tRNA hydrolase [Dehalococcoidia bacterium]|nr:Vms1/Ankzf1 family peptidyl-tRNA hydrolase [Dehalococcoidia bacterium]MDW8120261.1 Vms1/Ankzf1 family peptidyl-tRNA hydrolase [Chloroflexota bacterium]
MISVEEVRALEHLHRPGVWVLSVYLTVDPTHTVWPAPRTKVSNAIKALEASAPTPTYRKALLKEWERLDEWFAQWTPQGRGLVLFTAEPLDLWRTWHLPVPVPDLVRFQETAYTTPLLNLLDEYERYGVVLVEKQRARLFLVHLGQVEEEALVLTPVPQKHAQGGWSAPRFQRHHEESVKEHVRAVVQSLEEMLRQRRFDRLILGGPVEARTALEEALSPALRQRVVGTLSLHPNQTTPQEVLEASRTIEEEVERRREADLVEELITAAAKRGAAVLSPERTLFALHARQVHLLVVAHGWHPSGARCTGCALLTPSMRGPCPLCGGNLAPIPDLADAAAEQAIAQGVGIEWVKGPARERLLGVGGMGAFLTWEPRHSLRARRLARQQKGAG